MVALSSTISTDRLAVLSRSIVARCGGGPFNKRKRVVKWNVLPWPASLTTQMRPPIRLTSCAEIANPSPVPPYLRVVELST